MQIPTLGIAELKYPTLCKIRGLRTGGGSFDPPFFCQLNSTMELITEYWHQLLVLIGAMIVAIRLESEVKSLRKDLDNMTKELNRRDTYVETVKQRSEIDVLNKQVSSLWEFMNKLRDRFNGH